LPGDIHAHATPSATKQSKAKQSSSEFTDNNNLQRNLSKVSFFFTVKSLKLRRVSVLTQWSRVLLEKLLVAQKFNKSSPFFVGFKLSLAKWPLPSGSV
jgi:hypothetical protein